MQTLPWEEKSFDIESFLYINDPFRIRIAISFTIFTLQYKSTYMCTFDVSVWANSVLVKSN